MFSMRKGEAAGTCLDEGEYTAFVRDAMWEQNANTGSDQLFLRMEIEHRGEWVDWTQNLVWRKRNGAVVARGMAQITHIARELDAVSRIEGEERPDPEKMFDRMVTVTLGIQAARHGFPARNVLQGLRPHRDDRGPRSSERERERQREAMRDDERDRRGPGPDRDRDRDRDRGRDRDRDRDRMPTTAEVMDDDPEY